MKCCNIIKALCFCVLYSSYSHSIGIIDPNAEKYRDMGEMMIDRYTDNVNGPNAWLSDAETLSSDQYFDEMLSNDDNVVTKNLELGTLN